MQNFVFPVMSHVYLVFYNKSKWNIHTGIQDCKGVSKRQRKVAHNGSKNIDNNSGITGDVAEVVVRCGQKLEETNMKYSYI